MSGVSSVGREVGLVRSASTEVKPITHELFPRMASPKVASKETSLFGGHLESVQESYYIETSVSAPDRLTGR